MSTVGSNSDPTPMLAEFGTGSWRVDALKHAPEADHAVQREPLRNVAAERLADHSLDPVAPGR